MSEQFTPQEQFLIERLRRAPQPDLSQSAFEAIRVRLLDAMDAPPVPAPQPTLPVPTVAVVVIVIVIAIIIALVVSQQNPPPADITTPITTSSPLAAPSLTPTASNTPAPTASPSSTASPTITPAATVENITVIQGTVEAIDDSVITIFGVQVKVAPDDPLLGTIQIGDVIRVEGNTETAGSGILIIATTIIHVDVGVDVNVNPSSGEVWRDDGSCLNPPPDWAPAHGWRQRCQGEEQKHSNKSTGKTSDDDDDNDVDDDD